MSDIEDERRREIEESERALSAQIRDQYGARNRATTKLLWPDLHRDDEELVEEEEDDSER